MIVKVLAEQGHDAQELAKFFEPLFEKGDVVFITGGFKFETKESMVFITALVILQIPEDAIREIAFRPNAGAGE